MAKSHITLQADFSGGAVNPEAERRTDLDQIRASVRSAENVRIKAECCLAQRPGRVAIFSGRPRMESVTLPGDLVFRIGFGAHKIAIFTKAGTLQAEQSYYPWDTSDTQLISFDVVNYSIYVCFPGTEPIKIHYDLPSDTWNFTNFDFSTGFENEELAPFYRFPETKRIVMTPSGRTGDITLNFSTAIDLFVGQIFRFKERQIRVTGLPGGAHSDHCNAHVIQELPPGQIVKVGNNDGYFPGQVVTGSITGATGEVISTSGSDTVLIQLKNAYGTGASEGTGTAGVDNTDHLVGPTAASRVTAGSSMTGVQPSVEWDEIAWGPVRGWPQGVMFDRQRLTFYDIPSLPSAIFWSAVDDFTNFYVGPDPADPMFEFVPKRARILHMMGGPDQFVFTDKGTFFIPISESTPLAPGSVSFTLISSDPAGVVRPVLTPDGLAFINKGLNRVLAVVQTGAVAKPYGIVDIGEFASSQFKTPVCLAASSGDVDFPERYMYVVNDDGSVVVGRYEAKNRWVGWITWTGQGEVEWISSLNGEIIYSVKYASSPDPVRVTERQDDDFYVDCHCNYNNMDVDLAPPDSSQGPLWFLAGRTIQIMDGIRIVAVREVDELGFIVSLPGEDWTIGDVFCGLAYTISLSPFVPNIPEGPAAKQTMRRRRLNQVSVHVRDSTGFVCLGRTIPPYRWQDDTSQAPPLLTDTYQFFKLGRAYDPVVPITRDWPGPLEIIQIGIEVTV